MFGQKKEKPSRKSIIPTSSTVAFNSLVQGTSVKGDIVADSDIRIDGKHIGDIECAAKIIIGITGYVEGNIQCQNAVIEGRFKGSLKVHELLQVKDKAEIAGQISTGKILVQPGAIFNVVCSMKGDHKLINGASHTKANQKNETKNAQPIS